MRIFEHRTRDAAGANKDTLLNILELNKQTLFGKKFKFSSVSIAGDPIDVYRENVPLTRFGDYAGYIEKIARGMPDILTRDPADILAGSSGTTGVAKTLPNTRRARRKFMFFIALVQQGILSREIDGVRSAHRGINLMSLHIPPPQNGSSLAVGSANNAAIAGLRRLIPIFWSAPREVFGIPHQPTAHYLQALFGLADRNALYISAIFAPHLVSLFRVIEKYADQLIQDIRTGTLSRHLRLSDSENCSIESRLRADPERAEKLQAEFDKGFRNIIPRCWPNMKYISAVTTGSFSVCMPRLKSLTGGHLPIYSPCHASSEAIIGINLWPDRDDYVLTLGSAFFEFIPVADANEDQPDTVRIKDLEVGREYEIVLTNFAGLYRYRLEDVIRVMGFHNTAPIFKFLYRKGAILNLVGEKITEHHTESALTACIRKCMGSAGRLRDYAVAGLNSDDLACYAFFVELDDGCCPKRDAGSDMARLLDRELSKANYYYWSNGRNAGQLGPLTMNFVRPGTFDALNRLQDNRLAGAVTNQIKTPRVIHSKDQLTLLENAVIFSASGADTQYIPEGVTESVQAPSNPGNGSKAIFHPVNCRPREKSC